MKFHSMQLNIRILNEDSLLENRLLPESLGAKRNWKIKDSDKPRS